MDRCPSSVVARRERTLPRDQPAGPPRHVDGSFSPRRVSRVAPGAWGHPRDGRARRTVRGKSGRYPLRLRSSMACSRVFGLMPRTPTSSRMPGRAWFRGAPPPSMTCSRGSVSCLRIGIELCASTCRCMGSPILYDYTSTLGQSVSRAHPTDVSLLTG